MLGPGAGADCSIFISQARLVSLSPPIRNQIIRQPGLGLNKRHIQTQSNITKRCSCYSWSDWGLMSVWIWLMRLLIRYWAMLGRAQLLSDTLTDARVISGPGTAHQAPHWSDHSQDGLWLVPQESSEQTLIPRFHPTTYVVHQMNEHRIVVKWVFQFFSLQQLHQQRRA